MGAPRRSVNTRAQENLRWPNLVLACAAKQPRGGNNGLSAHSKGRGKMAEDWAVDVRKYAPDADDAVIKAIVRYCGIALRNRDSALVAFSDPAETDRVKKNYCRKKLALTDPDDVLDAAIAAVGERMKADRTKNRVTVYYLLAEYFGKLGLFGGAGAALAAAGAAAAPKKAAAAKKPAAKAAAPKAAATKAAPARKAAAKPAATAKVAAAMSAAAAIPATAAVADVAAAPAPLAAAAVLPPAKPSDDSARRHAAALQPSTGGFLGFAAAVFAGLGLLVFATMLLGQYIGKRGDAPPPAPVVAAPAPAPAAPPAPVIPDGAGAISETVNGMPKVSVYFDSGKADIAPDFAAAVAAVKAYADANPAARFAVSGYNDPTGNAAFNAELSKNRAQAVAAALAEQGVAADRIDLVKPADTTATDADLAQARRVEITVAGG
jgi:outer membrane protein OmpA-like peptidoglycan-associated protein